MILILEDDVDIEEFHKGPPYKMTVWISPDAYMKDVLDKKFGKNITFEDVNNIKQLLLQLAGLASMCWIPAPTGTFEPAMATEAVEAAYERLLELIKEQNAL